jgi:hypothetical protein
LDAYVRGLPEFLKLCEREEVDPLALGRTHVAVFVCERRHLSPVQAAPRAARARPSRAWTIGVIITRADRQLDRGQAVFRPSAASPAGASSSATVNASSSRPVQVAIPYPAAVSSCRTVKASRIARCSAGQ